MNTTKVNWYPAHPSCKSVSMLKYWRLLEEQLSNSDKYDCESVIKMPQEEWATRRSKIKVGISRHIAYPLVSMAAREAKIAHVLDHSWADLVNHMPDNMLKVVTVHDLIPLAYPGDLRVTQRKRFAKIVSNLTKADLLICVSHYTAREVQSLLGISADKIVVVPNGVNAPPDKIKHTRVREIINGHKSELIVGCLGNTLERKNIGILPQALKIAAKDLGASVTMVRAGALCGSDLHKRFVDSIGSDYFVELGPLNNDELEDFYANVDVIVVPSLYEGFGLPVLEAMARGVPVISSDTSSLPEVAGEAALFFDPHKPQDLAARLVQIKNHETAKQMVTKGLERASDFSWRTTLEGIFRAYDSLLL